MNDSDTPRIAVLEELADGRGIEGEPDTKMRLLTLPELGEVIEKAPEGPQREHLKGLRRALAAEVLAA